MIIALTEHRPLTTIAIDALDECEKVDDLLDALSQIVRNSSGLVKVFVSSRDDLVCQLQDYPNLEVEANHNQDDIASFVHHEISRMIRTKRLLHGLVPVSLKEDIKRTLCEKAQGM